MKTGRRKPGIDMDSRIEIVDKLNCKKVVALSMECEITDRRNGEKFTATLYEIVGGADDTHKDIAYTRLQNKANKIGCDIEILSFDDVVMVESIVDSKAVFKYGDK